MKIDELAHYDPAETLRDPQSVPFFLTLAFETADAGYIAHALGIAARSEGMTDIARRTGLSREALYRSLTENGNPTLRSVLAVLDAMGLSLAVVEKGEAEVEAEAAAPAPKSRRKA